jgi:hypothetical protein
MYLLAFPAEHQAQQVAAADGIYAFVYLLYVFEVHTGLFIRNRNELDYKPCATTGGPLGGSGPGPPPS